MWLLELKYIWRSSWLFCSILLVVENDNCFYTCLPFPDIWRQGPWEQHLLNYFDCDNNHDNVSAFLEWEKKPRRAAEESVLENGGTDSHMV